MTTCNDFASRRPGPVVIMRYNPRLSTCKADGRLYFFCQVLIDYGTFHDLLMVESRIARRDNGVQNTQRGEPPTPTIPSLSNADMSFKTRRRRTFPRIFQWEPTTHRGSKIGELLDPLGVGDLGTNLPQWLQVLSRTRVQCALGKADLGVP